MSSSRTARTALLPNDHRSANGDGPKPRNVCGCAFTNSLLFAGFVIVALSVALLVSLIVLVKNQPSPDDAPAAPYTPNQLELEANFRAELNGTRIGQHLYQLTLNAHIAGSPENYDTAIYVRDQMRSFGLDAELQPFDVLLCYPTQTRKVEVFEFMGGPSIYQSVLRESNFSVDPSTFKPAPDTFLAYSANGQVKAEVFYANYGQHSDFVALAALGVNMTGKIALVRYGQIYRGNKVSNAAEFGAIGCLIYSDPADVGFSNGVVYPDGPWGPEWGVQRGSIWNGNGDPATPGFPSVPYAARLSTDDMYGNAKTYNTPLPPIPALPLSWGDAQNILAGIRGQQLPTDLAAAGWKGGLNYSYAIGPGPVAVDLDVFLNYTTMRIYNVVAKIPGAVEEDRIVILGNHRDAWTFGGADPNSGTASLLELARSLGKMLATGWRPKRSMWLINWDAEEYATIGSVEFAEESVTFLSQRVVAYLNSDVSVTQGGLLQFSATTSLSNVTRAVSSSIPVPADPLTPPGAKTMYDLWMLESNNSNVLDGSDMGTGSDYGGLMQHVGVACLDLRIFGGSNDGYSGIYHTLYDDYHYMSTFADPNNFIWHRTVAAVWGSLALRLADSDILPHSYVEYVRYMRSQMKSLQTRDVNNTYSAAFGSIFKSIDHLSGTAIALDSLVVDSNIRESLLDGSARSALQLRQLNDQLFLSERCLMYWQGIPGREWYRHVVWVDDLYDGYGSLAFSAVNDAFTDQAGVAQALAMANLVLDNLDQCLTPPQWLMAMRGAAPTNSTKQQQQQQQRSMTGTPIQEQLLDRFYQLPASHSKPADKSHSKRVQSDKQFR